MSEGSVTVAVMAYNEVHTLERVVRETREALERLARPYELLIIDDGSTDGSGELADRLAAELSSVRVVHHPTNLALGGVYRTGFDEARSDLLTFMPADGQFPADTVRRLVEGVRDADLALGYLPDFKRPLVAEVLSFAERALYAVVLGRLPRFQGMFMVRTRLLRELPLKSTGRGWAIVMELVLRATRGPYRVVSVPTEIRPRTSGHSKVSNLPTIWVNFKQTLELRRLLD